MSIAAMKQALEALISSTGELRLRLASPTDAQLVKNEAAITALRTAIAEAYMQRLTDVQQEMDCYGDGNVYRGQRSSDSQYQTIRVQEPVAYVTGYHGGHLVVRPIEHVVCPTGMALYAQPPRREWVGLTEVDPSVEQLDQIIDLLARTHVRISARELLRVWIVAYTRAIETKLKEKNK